MTIEPRPRPLTTKGHTHKITTSCGNLYIVVNKNEDSFFEVFAYLGKSGGCLSSQVEGLCRTISVGLRAGIGIEHYAKQLSGIRCSTPKLWPENERVLSCSDGVAQALKIEIEREKERQEMVSGIVKKIESKETITELSMDAIDKMINEER